jgi:hypothetical protein
VTAELKAIVEVMRATPGLYVLKDPRAVNAIVPLWVVDGKIFSMQIDEMLDPERFLDDVKITGPVFHAPNA